MSIASAISLPPPRARPSILAMVTLGMFLKRSPIVCVKRKLRVVDTILEADPTRPKPEWAIKKSGSALCKSDPDALIGLEFPAEARHLPKGVTKESLASARSGLDSIRVTWVEAQNAAAMGDFVTAVSKAQELKGNAADIVRSLGVTATESRDRTAGSD
jgi:hypothetical protein